MTNFLTLNRGGDMTVEERQLRAWVRSVFRHAALRWLDRQRRQEAVFLSDSVSEEDSAWKFDHIGDQGYHDLEAMESNLWFLDCQQRLAPREAKIFNALYHGWNPTDVAQTLRCNVSTVRRAIYRIRNQCPR
jgi:RNA polymerase sigma factor (sigma-70 family)